MRIVVPGKYPTSCTFGGYDLSDLYVTTAIEAESVALDDGNDTPNGRSKVDEFSVESDSSQISKNNVGGVFVARNFWARGTQGSSLADLPEKEIVREGTPVCPTDPGMKLKCHRSDFLSKYLNYICCSS